MTRATTASQRLKTVKCRECGNDMPAGSNVRLPQRCVDCGVAAYEKAMMEIRQKAGPAYERYRKRVLSAFGVSQGG